MLPLETLLTFSAATAILCLSPGPSNLYIVARTLASGPRHGIGAASGMAIGSMMYVLASAFGLAAVFVVFPMSFMVLKLCGASYLVYLGIQAFLQHKRNGLGKSEIKPASVANIFKQSIWVELTNDKTALFFLAFLPLFVDPTQGSVVTQLVLLGGIYCVIAFFSDLFMVFVSNLAGKWLANSERFNRWQERISGTILLSLGAIVFYDVSR